MTCFDRPALRGYAATVVIFSAILAWPSVGWSKTAKCDVVSIVKHQLQNWAAKVASENPNLVVQTYVPNGALLLPTCKDGPLIGRDKIEGYFVGFLADKPVVTEGFDNPAAIGGDCTTNFASGRYTFQLNADGPNKGKLLHARYTFIFRNGLIVEHHSSLAPEIKNNACPSHTH